MGGSTACWYTSVSAYETTTVNQIIIRKLNKKKSLNCIVHKQDCRRLAPRANNDLSLFIVDYLLNDVLNLIKMNQIATIHAHNFNISFNSSA